MFPLGPDSDSLLKTAEKGSTGLSDPLHHFAQGRDFELENCMAMKSEESQCLCSQPAGRVCHMPFPFYLYFLGDPYRMSPLDKASDAGGLFQGQRG